MNFNWSLLFSGLSLAITLITIIVNKIKSIENYSIFPIDYAYRQNALQLLVSITNHSDTPLVISFIYCDGINCELEPKKIRGEPNKFGSAVTSQFPLCIAAHGCQFAYLEFSNFPHISLVPGKNLIFQIHSTRKQAQKTLFLGEPARYLHTKEQLQLFRDSQQKT